MNTEGARRLLTLSARRPAPRRWRCTGAVAILSLQETHRGKGRRLAALLPRARYAEIPGAYVLSMLDEPEAVAREMGTFLTTAPAASEPGQDQNGP